MQKIIPNLWFHREVEEAVNWYASIFKNAHIGRVMRYDAASAAVSGQPEGSVLTIEFQLFGQDFVALNGGPQFKFTPAISLMVNCETQDEVDRLWSALTTGGSEEPCGWLRDQYGVSWQIVPTVLVEMLADPDPAKAQRVMQAMLKMKKLDIARLRAAYEQS